jgi:hypothetical protein
MNILLRGGATLLIFQYFFLSTAYADEVILDDLIVDGSICVGIECMNPEDFNFDTIVLKSSDPQIQFHDTSTTSSFPTNDWTVGITDNGTGGLPTFLVTDVESGFTVLQLQADAAGGVAIGAGAEIVANAVSIGAAGTERRIAHLAEGTDPADAVNRGQFDAFAAQADQDAAADKVALDAEITDLQDRLDAINAGIDDLLSRVDAL